MHINFFLAHGWASHADLHLPVLPMLSKQSRHGGLDVDYCWALKELGGAIPGAPVVMIRYQNLIMLTLKAKTIVYRPAVTLINAKLRTFTGLQYLYSFTS